MATVVAAPPEALPAARPHEAAQEMDACLDLSKQVRSTIEELHRKQQQASTKLHERKAKITRLEKEVQVLETEREDLRKKADEYKQAYQTVRAAQKKAKEDMESHQHELSELRIYQRELEQLGDQYRQFKDKQRERARNMLERMTADSDITCMGLHFKAWVEDLSDTAKAKKFQENLQGAEGTLQEHMEKKKEQAKRVLDRMLGDQELGLLLHTWAAWTYAIQDAKRVIEEEARVRDTQMKLNEYMEKKKDEARIVLQRMLGDQEHGLLVYTIGAWYRVLLDEKALQDAEKKLRDAEEHMSEYQRVKQEQARRVLSAVVTGSDMGLLATIISYWKRHLDEAKATGETEAQLKASTDKMLQSMQGKKALAKSMLERNLALGDEAILGQTLGAWYAVVQDDKKERELQRLADAKVKAFQQRKRSEAMAVVERMVGSKGAALLELCFTTWGKGVMEVKRRKEIEAEVIAASEAEIKDLEARIAQAKEDLEDAEEELSENRTKNQKLKKEFQKLQDMERMLQDNFEDILKA
mmetsp:Transcript_34265/g.80062  ORF Transcript_34265/g.80062 Transcript_34265/m.80062 type:complete len:527 (-) Transcript_34265:53-1633(-)